MASGQRGMTAHEALASHQDGAVSDDLREIHELLRFVASGGLPTRETAVDYISRRSGLLESSISAILPGFLYQCGTIDRFKDFIFLYDPDPDLRCEFIDRMIDRARALTQVAPAPSPPESSAAFPTIWDF